MAYAPFDTAKAAVNDAAVELGLISADIADPFASTDPNIAQLCRLLKSCGRDLLRARDWTYLQAQTSFVTVGGQYIYPLPGDFLRLVGQTTWNRTTRLPAGGPLSPQEWQSLKARLVGVVFNPLVRFRNNEIELWPDSGPPAGHTIAFEYVSKFWVQPTGQPAATTDVPSASTDTLWFDPLLVLRALKLAWAKGKGFDTTAYQRDYDDTLSSIVGDDVNAPVVNMGGGGRMLLDPLLGDQNIPITGFGS